MAMMLIWAFIVIDLAIVIIAIFLLVPILLLVDASRLCPHEFAIAHVIPHFLMFLFPGVLCDYFCSVPSITMFLTT